MVRPLDGDEPALEAHAGSSYVLSWFEWVFAGDEYARAATKKALFELAVFYVLIGVGFLALWLTWKSNSNLKRWKRELAGVVARERGRRFEPDGAKMYGMF